MKVALIISGQPRFVNECAPYLIQNIVSKYDADVFSHLWFDEKMTKTPYKYESNWTTQTISSDAINAFKSIYNPKLLEVEESIFFQDDSMNFDASIKKYNDWK